MGFTYITIIIIADLISIMPQNCCIPLCSKMGYRIVAMDSNETKVTFHHKFPDATE